MNLKIGIPLRLGHLPVVMDFLRRSHLFHIIDRAVREDPRSKVSTSECVAVLLCSIFSGAHDLWRVRERLALFDMKTIMQDPGFDLDEFPEERLAKALDNLQAANLDKDDRHCGPGHRTIRSEHRVPRVRYDLPVLLWRL